MKKIQIALSVILACVMLFTFVSCSASGYNIPVVCGETGMNDLCGVATYGVNYYNLGVKAGDMAADVLLKSEDISKMEVQLDPNPGLSINEKVADEINFTIPESVKSKVSADATLEVTRNTSVIKDSNADYTIGILQLVQHVALDASNKGFVDKLSVRMAEAGKTMKILDQNASGEAANCETIASNFVNQNVNLIYTIATSAAQAAAAKTEQIPIIFCAITNPIDAGLVSSFEEPGKNVSGVSDINPVADQIDLIAELLGKTDITIGLLYTSSEVNSVYQIELAKKHCDAKGYKYTVKGIGDINELESALVALKKVDAIYIPTDNTLANGAASVHNLNIGK